MDISSLREVRSEQALSVADLNLYIKNKFESDRFLSAVSVRGEISNFTDHRSGHLYFTLKDSESQIKCVMFKSSRIRLKFSPENGMKVVARGSVSVYTRDGGYQLYISMLEPDGIGALYAAYTQLKEKLFSEGLFDEDNKLPIPRYPERIGVITSPAGAAVRDIINVTKRRYPIAKIYIYPSLVQGEGAVDNLIEALDYFEKSRLADVIIIGRGGGSIEDLWAFNSEQLARKIYSMSVPIISAVGHETDFTICDFVSDMRAPTPSAAAELCVPDSRELYLRLDGAFDRLCKGLLNNAERKRAILNNIIDRNVFVSPESIFSPYRDKVMKNYELTSKHATDYLKNLRTEFSIKTEKLNAYNPLATLSRGYSIVENESGSIRSVENLKKGSEVNVIMEDGEFSAKVYDVKKKKEGMI